MYITAIFYFTKIRVSKFYINISLLFLAAFQLCIYHICMTIAKTTISNTLHIFFKNDFWTFKMLVDSY